MNEQGIENARAISLAEKWIADARERRSRENTEDARYEVNLAEENLNLVVEDILSNGVDNANN